MNKIVIAAALLLAAGIAAPASAAAPKVIGAGTSGTCTADAQNAQYDAHAGVVDCTEALDNQPMSLEDRAATLVNRGTLHSRAGELAGALTDFNEAISMDRDNAAAYLNRSATLLGLKRYSDAKADADKAIQLRAKPLEVAYYNRAAAEEGLGDVTSAYHDYKTALKMQPGFTAAKNELARFKVSGGSDSGGAM
jgi:tetratricopeptide (TPR) repeat protein